MGRQCSGTAFPGRSLCRISFPSLRKKYRVKRDRDHRAMARLSMGSMQTKHDGLPLFAAFGWEGLFSGFMHNFIGEDPDNSYLEIMKEKGIPGEAASVFRAMGRQDEFWVFYGGTMLSVEENTGFLCAQGV